MWLRLSVTIQARLVHILEAALVEPVQLSNVMSSYNGIKGGYNRKKQKQEVPITIIRHHSLVVI